MLLDKFSKQLPQAIIIKVKKGGIRALLEFLRLHPIVGAVCTEAMTRASPGTGELAPPQEGTTSLRQGVPKVIGKEA